MLPTRRNRGTCGFVERLEGRFLLSSVPVHPVHPIGRAAAPVIGVDHDGKDVEQPAIVANLSTKPTLSVSTVPPNGDVNPYGVAFVPDAIVSGGLLHKGDVLVSNFNASSNLQGTGTTIVRISSDGKQSVFFQGKPGLGLTTALGVLQRGFVLVGNVPTTDGTSATVQQGSLLVIDRDGHQVMSISNSKLLDGPWDLTIRDEGPQAVVFVSNVLSGTVTRLVLAVPSHGSHVRVTSMTQIASGYLHRADPNALVVGPTGLAYDIRRDTLYVASTGDNAIYAIQDAGNLHKDAGKGRLVVSDPAHLRGPLELGLAPNGDLITTNGDAVNGDPNQPSEILEYTRTGHFVAQRPVNSSGQGGAFGFDIQTTGDIVRFAAVDDITNMLDIWTIDA